MHIRRYTSNDYEKLVALSKQTNLYGGQFDENRDSADRLQKKIEADPDAIFVAEEENQIVGTVSLIEDGRVAWLFRFCVVNNDHSIAQALSDKAIEALRSKGHNQVLVYAPTGNETFEQRYNKLGFTKGGDSTCFWKNLD